MLDAGIVQDFSYTTSRDVRLEYVHRELKDMDIYFIRNVDSLAVHVETTFRSVGVPVLWDPDTGEVSVVPVYNANQNTTTLPLQLSPYDSYVVVFRTDREGGHITEISNEGSLLFPGGDGFGLIGMSDEGLGLIFDGPGTYDIKYSSGRTDKFVATELLRQTIAGPWEVSFGQGWDAPSKIRFDSLIAWDKHEDGGIQVYSGIASYSTSFEMENINRNDIIWTLDLGNVYEVSDVKLNKVDLGVRSFAPFVYNLSGGVLKNNNLTIEVANLLNNRLVGEGRKPKGERKTKSNIQKLPSAWSSPMGDFTLARSGLIGPVTIVGNKVYKPGIEAP